MRSGKRDLIDEVRLASSEYLQWVDVAEERFGDVPRLGKLLLEMKQSASLYGMMSQKGLYEYRTKLDPEIWRELKKRFERQLPELKQIAAEELDEEEQAEMERITSRMEEYHDALAASTEDWFYKEKVRAEKKGKGCFGFLGMIALVPLSGIGWWFFF